MLQSEALLKFAMGCCTKGCQVELMLGAGPRQFGAGRPGGAALEIAEVRAAAAMRPGCALVGLDEQNAFGAIDWTDALRQTLRRAPAFAVPLSMLWRGGAGILVFVLRATVPGAPSRPMAVWSREAKKGRLYFAWSSTKL
jgi:hypothetical protein